LKPHGEEEASKSMAEKIKQTYNWNVTVPGFGDSFELE